MDSELESDSAHRLAKEIAKQPGWQAEAFLGMWPSEACDVPAKDARKEGKECRLLHGKSS
jgi:hypothetical protein